MRPGSLLAPDETVASVTIGVASAPNATGAVLAISATAAAFRGWKPSAISITTVIATGVPKPASASSSAPKQNAMMIACTRWSELTVSNERRSTSKCPEDDRQVVDPDRVDDDPEDREEAEGRTLGAGEQGLADRHVEQHDRDHEGDARARSGRRATP